MIREIINSYSICLHQIRRLVSDLAEDQMIAQTEFNVNHAAWTIGHLVCSAQMIGIELGMKAWLSKEWLDLFASGTTPISYTSAYPSKDELLDALDGARKRIVHKLTAMRDSDLGRPLADTRYREIFPSLGHAVLHILTVHPAIHLGQLTVWRRATEMDFLPAYRPPLPKSAAGKAVLIEDQPRPASA